MGRSEAGRAVLPAVAAALLTLVAAGCGGSGAPGGGEGGHADPALQAARCMRAHGVPNFPDPGPGAGLVVPNGIDTDAPSFKSAQRTCAKLLPGRAGPRPPAGDRLAMFALARCIRAHGVPEFPDPTSRPPSVGLQGASVAIGRGGMFLVVSNPDAPAFKRAAASCHFALPHPPAG